MDAIAMFGALAASEGSNAMAILTPVELPPGHVSWTTKDITVADQAFASKDQIPLLQTVLAAGACVVAWKEATFMDKTQDDEDEENPSRKPHNEE